MDQYCTLILLWLFSPIIDSLRGLQQASMLKTQTATTVPNRSGGGPKFDHSDSISPMSESAIEYCEQLDALTYEEILGKLRTELDQLIEEQKAKA